MSTVSSAPPSRRPASTISATTPSAKDSRCCSPRCATRPGSTRAVRPTSIARIVTALSQRLQVEDWYRRHPEIDDVDILPPLIGLGLPRTGSTALSVLLAQDPGDPIPAPVGVVAPVPAAVDRAGPGSPDPGGRGQHGRFAVACADRHPCSDGVSGADGAGFQIPYLPSLCADSVVLVLAGGQGRPHVDLRVSAAGDEAAELG